MIVEIPELNKIKLCDWLKKFDYTPMQQLEIDSLIENHVWVTAYRKQIKVKDMATNHINNCIKCLNGEGKSKIPDGYLGGKEKWLEIFNKEILNRQ